MPIARLDDRAVIAVTGKDAKTFLQGLITNDIEKASPTLYAALLTPQGKILFDFILAADDAGYLIDAAAAHTDDLAKRLKMYRLRAAVDLAVRPNLAVFAAWGDDASPDRPADPRLEALGRRWIAPANAAIADTDVAAYHRHRLTLGVPDSADVTGEFLLDANGEELHAVDFRKGCFVGQEVTARMKHKAQPRKRLVPVNFDANRPPPGTRLIDASGTEVGLLAGGLDGRALASVRLDRLSDAKAVSADGHAARIGVPAYPLPGFEPTV